MKTFVILEPGGTKAVCMVSADHLSNEDVGKLKRVIRQKHDLNVVEIPQEILSHGLDDSLLAVEKILEDTPWAKQKGGPG
jgi:hypothetical protein